MRNNSTKEKLRNREPVLGAMLGFNSAETVEMLGAVGFDFVTFDLEHEAYDELSLTHNIRAAESFDITPIVRVPNDPDLMLRLLDSGAQGVHVPRVNTAGDAISVVKACRFYPEGDRTFYSVGRGGNYGLGISEEDYASCSNREILVILQVEEMEGIQNLDEILKVPGVDAVQIGPKDLWQSMGMPDRSEVWEVVDQAIGLIASSGKWPAMVAWLNDQFQDQLVRYKGQNVSMITVSPREMLFYGAMEVFRSASNVYDWRSSKS